MKGFENLVAAAGLRLRPVRPFEEYWRVERLVAPRCPLETRDADPAQGRIFSIWLDRLSEPREPKAYRIRPLGSD